jgi:hypothetical protein
MNKWVFIIACLFVTDLAGQDADARKAELKKNRELLKIERTNCRKEIRIGKYSRRHHHRRVRIFTYDFNANRFICDGKTSCGCTTPADDCGPPFEIDERDAIQLRFVNVNPFLYTVQLYELQGDQISSENLMESNWNKSLTIKFEKAPSLEIDRIYLQYNKEVEKDLSAASALRDTVRLKQTKLEELVADTARTPQADKQLNSLMEEIPVLVAKIKKTESELNEIDEDAAGIKQLEGILRFNLNEIQDKFRTLNALIDAHNLLIYVVHNPSNSYNKIESEINRVMSGQLSNISIIDTRLEIDRLISSANETISGLISLDAKLTGAALADYISAKATYELIESKLETVSRDFARFDAVSLSGQIEFMKAMVTAENFRVQYETHSIAENADFVRYRIEFKPNTLPGNLTQGMSPFNMDIAFQIRLGWKYDVSPGFVVDIGLKDPSYYFDKTTDPTATTVYVRENGDNGNASPAIAAFLNGYLRTSATIKVGGSFGLGVSANGRFRMYFGPSLIIGRKERVVITGGASFGAISRLADGYEVGDAFLNNSSLPTEVPMVLDQYKLGGYVGIGFNLTGKKNQGFLQNLKFK